MGNTYNKITSIVLPETITSIGDSAFCDCQQLKDVYVLNTTPPSIYNWIVFNNNASGRKFYVPAESVDAYKAASGWSSYASYIEAIPS